MSSRPVSLLLGLLTFFLGAPTVIRLVGDHGLSLLVLAAVLVPLLAFPLLALLGAQLLLRRTRLAALTVVLLALDAVWLVPRFVADRPQLGDPVVVMTANLRFGEADPRALMALVKRYHVDVLATEELTEPAVQGLMAAGLEQELGYSELAAMPSAEGCGLWSRYPLDSLPAFAARFQSPGAVVHLPGRDVAVRVLHPFPATLGGGGGEFRQDYADLTVQVRRLDEATPTVLAGDLNASPDVSALRTLMGDRFREASEVAGSGLLRTWSPHLGWPALLHLDHVLVDQHFDVRSTQVVDVPGSDHRALVATLVLA